MLGIPCDFCDIVMIVSDVHCCFCHYSGSFHRQKVTELFLMCFKRNSSIVLPRGKTPEREMDSSFNKQVFVSVKFVSGIKSCLSQKCFNQMTAIFIFVFVESVTWPDFHTAWSSVESRGSQPGVNLPPGVNFTYPGGTFSDAEVTILCFFLQR